MERLTKTVNDVVTYIGPGNEFDTGMLSAELSGDQIIAVMNRLAAYEDSGIEPEQVMELKSLIQGGIHKVDDGWKHVQDLLQSEQDGRLVVLPCKVGDTIWRIKCFADWPDIGKPYVEADAFLYRDIHYFGKTVFLTREEAEAVLAQKGGESDA